MTRERIQEYVDVALSRGLTHVSITEHLFRFQEAFDALFGWWDADPDPTLAKMVHEYWKDHVSGSVTDYVHAVEDAKNAGLPVLLGLEMDWIPGHGEALAKFLAPYDWDIVLGSVHYVGSFGFDDQKFRAEWDRRDVAEVWDRYSTLVREAAESGLVDVLAHPDLPKVFGFRPADETPFHDAILAGAAKHETALELNSNGLRRCAEIYPAIPLLERAHASGLPITLASDAHHPERVGADFDSLVAWARRAGYAGASAFVQRQRRDLSFDD